MRKRRILEDLAAAVDDLDRKLDRIEVAILVRDPGTALSADAYDGLRKQIIAAASDRVAHLAQLAQLDAIVRTTGDGATSDFRPLVQEWMAQANLVAMSSPDQEDLFEIVGGSGPGLDIIAPAYVDATTRRLIRQGRARRTKPAKGHEHDDQVDAQVETEDEVEPEAEPIAAQARADVVETVPQRTSAPDKRECLRLRERDSRWQRSASISERRIRSSRASAAVTSK